MQKQQRRDTAAERALRSALHRRGLRFRVDYKLPGLRRRADIAFPRQRIAVMVDGCFWHGCPVHGTEPKANSEWWRAKIAANQARDVDTNTRLAAEDWHCERVWEHESPDSAAEVIAELVRNRRRIVRAL